MSAELIAHRGGVVNRRTEENTLAAIERAADAGYYGVEIDVRETADHVPILYHEAKYRPGLLPGKLISNLTYDAVAKIAERSGATAPLTIEEAAAVCEGKLRIMLEVKEQSPSDGFLERVESVLAHHGLIEGMLVIGTKAGKSHFAPRAPAGIRAKALHEALDSSEVDRDELAATRFLFDHGNVLVDKDCERAAEIGMLIVPSVNTFHYRKERPRIGARRDIARLLNQGITKFQIDSVFEDCFDA